MTTVQPARARRSWDTILTIILLVLLVGWTIACSFAGALIALVSDSCGSGAECNTDLIGFAVYFGMLGPVVLGLVVLGITISRLVRKRIAFFVPLIGGVLALALEIGAFVIASSAVTPFS